MVLRCLVCVVSLLAVLLMAFVPTGLVQAAVPVGMDGVAYEDGGFEMAQKSARDEGSTYSIAGRVMDGSGIGVENVLISAAENWWQVFLPQILLGAATADRITYDHYMENGSPPDSGNLATGTVLTDANGYYVLPSLPPGNYTLMASKNGFEITPASQTVILLSDITVQNFQAVNNNRMPHAPATPKPADGSTGVSTDTTLTWTGGDPDGDSVTYDVYFGTATVPVTLMYDDLTATSTPALSLAANTTYTWRVEAADEHGATVTSAIWQFTTLIPNQAPDAPSLPSPADGSTGVSTDTILTWSGSDPDGDSLTYDVYFGTATVPVTLMYDDLTATSTPALSLATNTTYYWRVVARDEHGLETAGPVWNFLTTSMVIPPGMIYIPAGSFVRGCDPAHNNGESCDSDELASAVIYLNAFFIDTKEVTTSQYAQCVSAGSCTAPTSTSSNSRSSYYGNPVYADYPVIYVTWQNAVTYCTWAGKRLPTEAEWEKAARGSTDTRAFAWGDSGHDCSLANHYDFDGTNYNFCVGDTDVVGNYPAGASPYGVLDMIGNVAEWVNDWYSSTYYSVAPSSNPPGPVSGSNRVYRGGSHTSGDYSLRVVNRENANPTSFKNSTIGFRCAATAP